MGLKTSALALVRAAGVPTLPGYEGGGNNQAYQDAARRIGYPVLVKAVAGGGGRGMRIVRDESDLSGAVESAQSEAEKAFSDGRVFLEKYIQEARHVEFQIFADSRGHTVHLLERDCSIQRRHQKIIEESQSPFVTPELREKMGTAAVNAARAVGYVNAGTVEFIVDVRTGDFYFLEMNTRLQVEHPVTEAITGLDLVKLQIHVAQGDPLPFTQSDITRRGHAIECRVYAEDPSNNFLPSTGTLLRVVEPQGPGVRVDSGVRTGDTISIHYDPMIAKVIVHGQDRLDAIRRMDSALAQYVILGLTTNVQFLREVINHPDFVEGHATTALLERHFANWQPPVASAAQRDETLIAAALSEMLGGVSTPRPVSTSSDVDADLYSPWERSDSFRIGT
jgi:acetyl/propionyl-CoA carboxylase alpha subunit